MQENQTNEQAVSTLVAEHVAKHTLQLTPASRTADTAQTAAAMGGGSKHPAVTKHLQPAKAASGMGGGSMHPALSKHLQAQASA